MMLKKKIALVQFNAVPEEKDINLGHMQRLVGEAVDAGARWIVFHEATLTDYTPKLTPERLIHEARAIKAPVLLTNRVGRSWTHESPGGCAFISARGEILARANMEGREEILLYELEIQHE
jgi:predicted amidohydrolase